METLKLVLVVCLAFIASSRAANVHPHGAHDVGVGPMPVKESEQMKEFKSSLTPEQLQTLKNHYSKSRFIQALLGQQQVVDKRDHDDVALKTNSALVEYYKHLTPDEQELVRKYPSQTSHLVQALEDRQNAEAAGQTEEETQEVYKREISEQEWSGIIKDLLTHTNALREVLKQAADQHETKEELMGKVAEDVGKAKEKGVQLKDLLRILGIPESGSPQPHGDHLKTGDK